ncbi:MAG UNVERIFIED_CONTAM: hypothetical protein LVR18_17975 [Planctomycetaceae bacterium]|jgi:exodeoxyribonuclease-3
MMHQTRFTRLSAQSLCLGICLLLVNLLSSLPSASADEQPRTLRLVTHNVYYGFTKRGEPRYGEWKRWMAAQAPDIVSLQELNAYTSEKLSADAASWGHAHSVLLKPDGFSTGITSRYPISDVRLLRDGFHHGLLPLPHRRNLGLRDSFSSLQLRSPH